MRYQISAFQENFFTLMGIHPNNTLTNNEFRTKIDRTEITVKANYLGHISTITIRTELSTGFFSENAKKKQLSTHVKAYVMAVGSLIDMDEYEVNLLIANMLRTIPYTGKGIKSKQYQIQNGWQVSIDIPISDIETRIKEYYSSRPKYITISPLPHMDELFNIESFIYNFNRNLCALELDGIHITEINLGEFEEHPALIVKFSHGNFALLGLESDYTHFTSVTLFKDNKESVSNFTQKTVGLLLCFIPDRKKAISLLLDNFIKSEVEIPFKTKNQEGKINLLFDTKSDVSICVLTGHR